VINENLARRSFGHEDPVGREIVLLPGGVAPWMPRGPVQIVGVVANSKEVGMNEVDFNGLYVPFAQAPSTSFQIFVRSAVPPAQVVDPVRSMVRAADKDLPAPTVTVMTARVADAVKGDRFNLILIGSFALVALLLACVAIYAAMAYAVEQRTAEFGLRFALGAQRLGILWNALWSSLRLGLLGTAIGFGAVVAIARVIGDALYLVPRQHEGLLYGITTTDPATLAITSALLVAVAALAGLVPAGRAMRVDPAIALRNE
jgi:putative ABC transport system permease protein